VKLLRKTAQHPKKKFSEILHLIRLFFQNSHSILRFLKFVTKHQVKTRVIYAKLATTFVE